MNIALIGLGMVAATHVAAINASPHRLVGVMGRDIEKAQRFAADLHDVRVYATIDEVAADPAIDFVIVATPPDARQDIIAALVRAGKPILAEKPIERTWIAAQEIVSTCEGAGVPFAVTLQHRARDASQALKTTIDAGDLGEVATLDMRVPWWRDQDYYDTPGRGTYARDGGGVMLTQAIHTLDLGLWLAGPITRLTAMMHRTPLHDLEAEDWATAQFTLAHGGVGTLSATTATYPGAAESISIQGTKAAATLASGVLTLHHLDGRTETIGATASTGGGADPMAFTHAWHQTIIEDFANCLTTGAEPMASGRSALMAHAVIHAMETSSKTRSEVEVDMP